MSRRKYANFRMATGKYYPEPRRPTASKKIAHELFIIYSSVFIFIGCLLWAEDVVKPSRRRGQELVGLEIEYS